MALWTPSQIDTALWLDAADSSTITIATGVSQWNDKSGNARHALQSTGTRQPSYESAVLNGLPVVRFDGSNDTLLTEPASIHSGPWSVFAVAKGTVSGAQQIITQDVTSGTLMRIAQYIRANDGGIQTISFNTAGSNYVAAASGTVSDWLIHGASLSATELRRYVDGVSGTPTTTAGTPMTGSTNVCIGSRKYSSAGVTTEFWNGDIAEVVFVAGTPDLDTRQKIEGYLAHKWGLEAGLLDSHPYSMSAPTNYSFGYDPYLFAIASAGNAPTLTFPGVTDITATSARPQVTLTY